MIVVLTGAPGAGKGTQAELLAKRGGFKKLSTGDALRKHVKAGTSIGKLAGAVMERGELVSDELLFSILREELALLSEGELILLDGYPRNIAQAEALDSLKSTHPVKAAILLDVPRQELVARLSGRRVCGGCGATYHVKEQPSKVAGICDKCGGELSQRPDDTPSSVNVRLDIYEKATRPVLEYYRKHGVFREVVGVGDPESIYGVLRDTISGF
jgi:adenylate kinase